MLVKVDSSYNISDIYVIYAYVNKYDSTLKGLVKVGMTTLDKHAYNIFGTRNLDEIIAQCDEKEEGLFTHEEIYRVANNRIHDQKSGGSTLTPVFTALAAKKRENGKALGLSEWETFKDYDLHRSLKSLGIKNVIPNEKSHEWYQTDEEQVKKSFIFHQTGILPSNVSNKKKPAIILRPEQQAAIDFTNIRFEVDHADYNNSKEILWSAIMRFGKTLTAYKFVASRPDIKKILIVTHRPVVIDGWKEDFKKVFEEEGYNGEEINFGAKGQDVYNWRHVKNEDSFIYFASMQDLRGSFEKEDNEIPHVDSGQELSIHLDPVESFNNEESESLDKEIQAIQRKEAEAINLGEQLYKKNKEIFDTEFDLTIIDEGHEGTQTYLAKSVWSNLKSRYRLYLSGTPFNIVRDFDFEDVYSWDYIQEQQAKEEYSISHPEQPSPYSNLPQMVFRTFDLGKEYPQFKDNENYTFSFNDFFRTVEGENGPEFDDLENINKFLNRLHENRLPSDKRMFPFENAREKSMFKHTLWVLHSVDAATALEKVLKEDNFFGDFEIVNVTGTMTSTGALQKVKDAIATGKSTITLTFSRLTMGTTVPEWTGVFMLSNMKSAMSYMQTAFRVKSSGILSDGSAKEKGYVFDFAPHRVLEVLDKTAKVVSYTRATQPDDLDETIKKHLSESSEALTSNVNEQEALGKLLKYLPVISEDNTRFVESDSVRIMSEVRRVIGARIKRSGFTNFGLYNMAAIIAGFGDTNKLAKLRVFASSDAVKKSSETKRNITIKDGQGIDLKDQYNIEKNKRADKKKDNNKDNKEKTPEEIQYEESTKQAKEIMKMLNVVSVRIPMMIFALSLNENQSVSPSNFTDLIDEKSWAEFMPKALSRKIDDDNYIAGNLVWDDIKDYYDAGNFAASCMIVRDDIDNLSDSAIPNFVLEVVRIMSSFRSPDKETVLTPFKVVNLQYANTLGGLRWVNDDDLWYCENDKLLTTDEVIEQKARLSPIWVDNGYDEIWKDEKSTFFDINSKTAYYPLFAALSLWYKAMEEDGEVDIYKNTRSSKSIWHEIVQKQIFINCRVPYSARIAGRVLNSEEANTSVVDVLDVVGKIKDNKIKDEQAEKIWQYLFSPNNFSLCDERYREIMAASKEELSELKVKINDKKSDSFTAIVSNPPYQLEGTERAGSDSTAINIFPYFYEVGEYIGNNISMIFPGGRWMQRSKGCDSIADLIFKNVNTIDWFPNGDEKGVSKIFPNVRIGDGISIVSTYSNDDSFKLNGFDYKRPNNKEIIPLQKTLMPMVTKAVQFSEIAIESKKSSSNFFKLRSFFAELNPTAVKLVEHGDPFSKSVKGFIADDAIGKAKKVKEYYIDYSYIDFTPERLEMFKKWKVCASQGHASKDPSNATYKIVDNEHVVGESWMIFGNFDTQEEAQNYLSYITSKTVKTLLESSKGAKLGGWGSFVPDLEDYTDSNPHIDWSKPLDPQLYKLFNLTQEEIDIIEGK